MKKTTVKQKNRKANIVRATVIAIIGIIVVASLYFKLEEHKIIISPARAKEYQNLLEVNKKHIEKVSNENDKSAEIAIKNVEIMFERIREKIPETVSELYSLKSKCKYIGKGVADKWPWSEKRDRLTTMVEGIFNKHLGNDEFIQKSLMEIEKDYTRSLIENKNNLLLNLEYETTIDNQYRLNSNHDKLMKLFNEQLTEFTGPMIGISLGGEVTSLIVSEAVSVVVVYVVASATGCAIGEAATLGVGILVGVGVDLIVTKYAKEVMVEKLIVAINEMEKIVLNGTKNEPGMIARLNKKAREMTEAEQKAIESALFLASK